MNIQNIVLTIYGILTFGCTQADSELLDKCRNGDSRAREMYARTTLTKELRRMAKKKVGRIGLGAGFVDKGRMLPAEEVRTIDESKLVGGLSNITDVDEGGLYVFSYAPDRRWEFSIYLNERCEYQVHWSFSPADN